ncbi:hypothetical protein SRB5_06210 [Streptomyces sp. RB5]|uniref:Serpin domain-containing protein n=1 Tax=Streptomyces smaragdinus TaxID=2585196 RepID=A0A7K0CAV2_9ACTN|nr:serpin family protein [Streptomyces smaragdinus]MQY10513.1 hypothetical protein [Streptomyces smaragdinus]
MISTTTVRAVNAMTARWARTGWEPGSGSVFAAPGAWPLIGLLAGAADGPARTELEGALGVPAHEAARRSWDVLDTLADAAGVDSALGLWIREDLLRLRPEWEAGLPAGVRGALSGDPAADQDALDAWAAARTDGLIPAMPVPVTDDTELVLASALLLRTTWLRPFQEAWGGTEEGPWAGRDLHLLHRVTSVLDRLRVIRTSGGPHTMVEVVGDNGTDVHLVLGPEGSPPGEVLAAGAEAIAGRWPRTPGGALPLGEAGPGVEVSHVRSERREDRLLLETVQFGVDASHDLVGLPEVFGLSAAADTGHGHFPGISSRPLAVGAAAQHASATFGPLGFRAGAVTAVAMVAGGVPAEPRQPYIVKHVDVRFLRPFGFLAVHRRSKLILAAGWVETPDEYDVAAELAGWED